MWQCPCPGADDQTCPGGQVGIDCAVSPRIILTAKTPRTPAANTAAAIATQPTGRILPALFAQQFLYFRPLPQGQRSLRPIFLRPAIYPLSSEVFSRARRYTSAN